jgi:hypothetical protein
MDGADYDEVITCTGSDKKCRAPVNIIFPGIAVLPR